MEADGEITQIRRVIGVGEAVYVAAGARAEVVRALGAPELRAPDRVVMQGEAVVALMPVSSGATLADALRASGPLSAGGCVWVGTRVARALARLHRAGMAHGAVDAECILLESGSAVLLDTGAGVAAATQEDDVAALGRLLRSAVRPADVDVMAAWTDPMSAIDPSGRPTAAMVARALPGAAEERPVSLAGSSVAARMRESAASSDSSSTSGGRGKGKPASARKRSGSVDPLARQGSWWSAMARRLSTTPTRLAVLAAVAATAVIGLGTLGLLTWGQAGGDDAAAAETTMVRELSEGAGGLGPGDPAEAAAALTERRFTALSASDADSLLATTAIGSAARERAEAQAASVTAGELSYEGLHVEVKATGVQEQTGDVAVVSVEYETADYVAIVEGERVESQGSTERVELTLVIEHGRWRVSEVSAS